MTTATPTTVPSTTLAPTTCVPADSEENFSGANPLNNWTKIWQAARYNLSIVDADGDARVGLKDLHWDSINAVASKRFASYDSPDDCKNVDLLALVDPDTPAGNQMLRLYARVSGSEGSENAYFTNINSGMRIYKYVAGVATDIISDTDFELFVSSPMYWMRFRINGASLKVKVWNYYSHEPVEWGLSTTDSDLTIGKVGIGQSAQDDFDLAYFATGVGGSSPSVPALTHGDVDCLSALLMSLADVSTVNYCRFIPYRVPSTTNNKWVYKVGVYFGDVSADVRLSLYKGSDETDITDAVLIEDFGQVSPIADSWNYYSLSSAEQISTGDVFYIGIKGNDGTTKILYTDSPVQASVQLSNGSGRWDATTDLGEDETVAFPANLAGATNAVQDDFWYSMRLYLRNTETTTAPPTTSAPTTPLYTTVGPTTVHVATTPVPTTAEPTLAPTSLPPTSLPPTTIAPTTIAATTPGPPTTLYQTTIGPTTKPPATTTPPTTAAPTTSAPTSLPPTTIPPTTTAPTTTAPTSLAPTTLPSTTLAPTTLAPTTLGPTTIPSSTIAPTTLAPTTLGPTVPPTTNIPEIICIKNLRSVITKEIRSDGYLC